MQFGKTSISLSNKYNFDKHSFGMRANDSEFDAFRIAFVKNVEHGNCCLLVYTKKLAECIGFKKYHLQFSQQKHCPDSKDHGNCFIFLKEVFDKCRKIFTFTYETLGKFFTMLPIWKKKLNWQMNGSSQRKSLRNTLSHFEEKWIWLNACRY